MKINKKVENFAVNELGVDPRYDSESDNMTIEEWRLVEALQKVYNMGLQKGRKLEIKDRKEIL